MNDTKDAVAYTRLRAIAIATIADPAVYRARFYHAETFLLALSGYADDAWIRWDEYEGATDGQWFVWRDPDSDEGIHVDRVNVVGGKIIEKESCDLELYSNYSDCQPCRFDDDVVRALKAAGQFS